MTQDFFPRDPAKALIDIKETLYERMHSRERYAAQDPLKDPFFKGLQKGAMSEIDFLKKLLDKIERS